MEESQLERKTYLTMMKLTYPTIQVPKSVFTREVLSTLNESRIAPNQQFPLCSASGDMLPAYVVYKAENLLSTWTEGGPKGTQYNRSRSGWFDACCFNDWFETLFVTHARKLPGKKVLIGDNLSSHFTPTVLQLAAEYDILFVCLPPNATHLLQPLDIAFYRPLKGYWRKVNRSCVFAEFCQQLFVRLIIPFQNWQDNIYKIVLTVSTFI